MSSDKVKAQSMNLGPCPYTSLKVWGREWHSCSKTLGKWYTPCLRFGKNQNINLSTNKKLTKHFKFEKIPLIKAITMVSEILFFFFGLQLLNIRGGVPPRTTFRPFLNNGTLNRDLQQLFVPPRSIQCPWTRSKPNPWIWAHVPTPPLRFGAKNDTLAPKL